MGSVPKKKNEHFKMGQNFKRLVKDSGMSFTQFASALGVTHDTVMKWFAGNNLGYLRRSEKICEILGVSVLELHGKQEERKEIKVDKDQEISYLKGRIDALEAIVKSLVRSGSVDFSSGMKKNGTE
ncbi:hypothetical protein GWN26_09085 [Candidatus Saccharibacteria bacterium]|nr:helix-turn-helix transcriptional regulator [Candidatus Saccharibacteria bacterium]NIS52956.1 helix-turn-helix transcriptional regulator [Phycisphaerae bacterium]NIV03933.1 hypothetical protein [Calditrichia bacterium]NIV72291.1 hypothetical protein [Calditrichia bacterium]NIV99273.1 hypothetical protein [Candidatus Saccharibacteria bacterium]